jgi:hypothetical protein
MDAPPPLSLGFPMFVIEYAVVDTSIIYHERKNLNVGGEWLGAVPKLAISLNLRTSEYHLSHCNDEWEDLCSVESRKTIQEIKALAERRYEGIGEKWIPTDYTETEAEAHFRELTSEWTCSFCNKSWYDGDMGGMIVRDHAKICYVCIKSFAGEITRDNT